VKNHLAKMQIITL